jgi:hypothetical protein
MTMSVQHPAGYSCWGKPPAEDEPKADFPVLLPQSLFIPVFLRDFPIMVLNQQLLANLGLTAILALGMLSAPSLQAKNKPGVYSGTPYGMLGET